MAEAPTIACPPPGIYPGVPFAEYVQWEAVNQSRLKPFAISAALGRHEMLSAGRTTAALDRGDGLHAYLLSPAAWASQYVAAPKVDRRTTAGKAAWVEFEAACGPGVIPMPADEHANIQRIGEAVKASEIGRELLGGKGLNEVSVVWIDRPTGLLCKARIDRLTYYGPGGYNVLLDLKSTRVRLNPPFQFRAEIARYRYHVQLASYRDALTALAEAGVIQPAEREVMILAVETDEPFGVRAFGLDETAVAQGRAEHRRLLNLYAACAEADEWPGYDPAPEWIGLPKWAYDEEDA